jgi:hypothetical protein
MTFPITIGYSFQNATTTIPLSSLDANFTQVVAALNGISSGAFPLVNAQGNFTTLTAANGTSGTQVVNFSQFNPTLGSSGILYFPGGGIFQWGSGVSGAGGNVTINYGTVFSTATDQVFPTLVGSSPGNYGIQTFGYASNGFQAITSLNGVGQSGIGFNYFAIGQ